jgi:DNA-binding transcriptional MerR regulator
MAKLRPVDLAREHAISAQAVRNYERDGILPPARRTPTGYRVYTELHAAALRAFLALVPAYGHANARRIMRALNAGERDEALTVIDRGHAELLRDRDTLDAVRRALAHLNAAPAADAASSAPRGGLSIGELADRLGVTAETLRNWEEAGILIPRRTSTGRRTYDADDVRDAELAHLLRRGGYLLAQIAPVVQQIRTAGGTRALHAALGDWQRRLTARGVAMLHAAGALACYLEALDSAAPDRP